MEEFNNQVQAEDERQLSFFEIFKHVWPVLWEKPKLYLPIILVVSALTVGFDGLSQLFLNDYETYLDTMVADQSISRAEAFQNLVNFIKENGLGLFAFGLFIPFLAAPFVSLAHCKATLDLFDGYDPSLKVVGFAARKYLTALWVAGALALWGCLVFTLFIISFIPFMFLNRSVAGQGFTLGGLAANLAGIGICVIIFLKFLWPHVRRIIVLSFLIYFQIADGFHGQWIMRLRRSYTSLALFPRHLNQAVAIMIGLIFITTLPLGLLSYLLTTVNLDQMFINIIGQFIFHLSMAWFILSLAGFYRLVLNQQGVENKILESEVRDFT
ncbi:MAG: hypothetical protein LBV23_01950 [Deltaproteobacteria bacterium]|jgi:hypothetical protein|nr:hypothetical protein [Deltaproteobacteria bacterium]